MNKYQTIEAMGFDIEESVLGYLSEEKALKIVKQYIKKRKLKYDIRKYN